MKLIWITAILAVTVIAFACNSTMDSDKKEIAALQHEDAAVMNNKTEDEKQPDDQGYHADSISRHQQVPPGEKQKQQPQKDPVSNPDWDKKIIKTAVLNVEVKDYNAYYTSLREKVRAAGGYIAQEQQTQSGYKIENSIAIKVPVDQFDNAIVEITGNTEKINEKKITSQDVTTEVIDTKSRIEAKKQVRSRYMDLLKDAKNMQEILSVQSEINGVQEQIESAAGRIAYLGHSSTFSTIHLTYFQILNSAAKDTDKPSFGAKLSSAFSSGASWVVDLFVGLVSIWPLFVLIFTAIIIYKRTKIQKPKQA